VKKSQFFSQVNLKTSKTIDKLSSIVLNSNQHIENDSKLGIFGAYTDLLCAVPQLQLYFYQIS
jgi:hypothetical protein